MERIPASIRNRRDFDARNYVDSKTYRNIVSMAKMNIHDRKTKLNQVNEIASTHDHHKPGEDDNYRNNVEIEPCRSYQNVILSNSVINSVNESTAPTASAPTVRSTWVRQRHRYIIAGLAWLRDNSVTVATQYMGVPARPDFTFKWSHRCQNWWVSPSATSLPHLGHKLLVPYPKLRVTPWPDFDITRSQLPHNI